MRIDQEIKLDFKDVLIRPKRSTLSSRSQVNLCIERKMKHSGQVWTGVPCIAANMDTVGTFEVASVLAEHKIITAVHKHYSTDQWKEFMAGKGAQIIDYIAVSTGIHQRDMDKLDEVLKVTGAKMICMDVANGYSEAFVKAVRDARARYPKHTIMAGNVVTGEMTEELILSGADIVKVGIGPGSVCTTRKLTGVG